ncbi:DUF4262 domain-containing protein [Mucilaginibacter conchicola]|uniref:DUF4262 domain-containing protein n=1 Tax=Mucilaginibacter conchicola TaxID=2303333 RepID=A0A372NST3_9SPHI|nr:DUF4262 domain-containing protein [Mucilaginibacter conchicola]RFZ92343.1 DUF4262 domain-containing protein [Mucilaginibacter conchicola]
MPEQDDYEQIVIDNIAKYGCHLTLIESNGYTPAFIYSIGLYQNYGHPEIICVGLDINVMAAIINGAKDMAAAGETIVTGKLYQGFLQDYDVQFLEVQELNYFDYLGFGSKFYQGIDYPVLQMVWPDKQNKFPWEDGFNEDWKYKQPLLDRNANFRFYESETLGVYTTSDALAGAPVLYVYHNENGDWQFHTSLEPDINDGKLVCLKHLVEADPSLNSIYFLQYGWAASRADRDAEWEVEESPDEDEDTDEAGDELISQPDSVNKPPSAIKKMINWLKGG